MSDREGTSGAGLGGASIRAEMVLGLSAYATARGLSREQVLEATGVSLASLLRPGGRVPEMAFHRLWKLVGEHCPGEAVALQLAAVAPLSDFGVLAHTLRYAESFRAALQMVARYGMVLAESIELTLIDGPEETFLRVHHPLDEVDGGHAAELGLALLARVGREAAGAVPALARVELRHAAHGPRAQYSAFFEVPVEFECPHNALVFRSDRLDETIGQGDAHMLDYLRNHLELVRERLATATGSRQLARVRAAIAANAERGEYGAQALARRLGTSLRALQRQVRAEGATVGALEDEVRQANARQLLGDHRLAVEEIAFLLGYSSARAFRRACLRWTGQTPGQLRGTPCREPRGSCG